jgi:hypothetical protein
MLYIHLGNGKDFQVKQPFFCYYAPQWAFLELSQETLYASLNLRLFH